jgi:predicted alpha/beta superfamily hydrolase/uncharacterized protein involved in tolerance to divalent cations
MSADYLVVLVTIPNAEDGMNLGQKLVEEELAACVQVIPGGMAIFRWLGKMHAEPQTQLLIKTRRGVWPALQSRILALHGDDVPEIVALPVADGLPAYLGWLDEMTTSDLLIEAEALPLLPPAIWLDYSDVYPRGHHTIAGTLRILRGLYSPQLDNTRDILVYLPPSYPTGGHHYPVLYMHDGQNLFDGTTSYAGEWYVDETMEGLASQGIEAIVVGLPNIGLRRYHEYIPFPSPDLPDAQGELYVNFIADTVKPMIDRDFRTLPGRTTTGIMGSSLGGLISLYGFFKRSDTFGLAGVVSPALRWGKQGIFPFVTQSASAPGKIYIDVGTAEGTGLVADPQSQRSFAEHYVQQVRRMNALLKRKGYRIGETLLYVEEEGAIHHESAWARRLPAALRFLLGAPPTVTERRRK